MPITPNDAPEVDDGSVLAIEAVLDVLDSPSREQIERMRAKDREQLAPKRVERPDADPLDLDRPAGLGDGSLPQLSARGMAPR